MLQQLPELQLLQSSKSGGKDEKNKIPNIVMTTCPPQAPGDHIHMHQMVAHFIQESAEIDYFLFSIFGSSMLGGVHARLLEHSTA